MDFDDRYEVEEIVKEKMRKLPRRGSFYDDYENDYIELWDAIESLQKSIEEIKLQLRALALMPITK